MIYDKTYLEICKENIKNENIYFQIKNLKFILDYPEIKKIEKILSEKSKSEIEIFFRQIKIFEKKKYKNFQEIDYFFLSKLNEKLSYKENLFILKEINKNFIYYCKFIEKINKDVVKKIRKTKKTRKFTIIGGFNLFIRKKLLKISKDVDLIDLNEKKKNILLEQFELKTRNRIIITEIFSKNDIFFRYLNLNSISNERYNKYNILPFKIIKTLMLNSYGIERKNYIFVDSEINKAKNPNVFGIKFYSFPITIRTNDYINYIIIKNKETFIEKIFFLNLINKKYESEILLLINLYLNDLTYSKKIHDIIYNKIVSNKFRSKNDMVSRLVAIRIILFLFSKKLDYRSKTLEEKLYLFSNLEIILKRIVDYYIKNYSYLRNHLN